MTALLERAFARVRSLPESDQDAFASVLLAALDPEPASALDDETRAAIREGVTQAERGEFVPDDEIDALLRDSSR